MLRFKPIGFGLKCQYMESQKLPGKVAFSAQRALTSSRSETVRGFVGDCRDGLRIGEITTLGHAAPEISVSALHLGEIGLVAMASHGVDLHDVSTPVGARALLVLPIVGACSSPCWQGQEVRASDRMALWRNANKGVAIRSVQEATFASLSPTRLRDVWETMIGFEMLERIGPFDLHPVSLLSVDDAAARFHNSFMAIYALIDSFDGDEYLLLNQNVDDALYRIIACALTPEVFRQQEVESPGITALSGVSRTQIDAVCDLVWQNIATPVSLTEMERVAGAGKKALLVAFNERFGMSPVEWQLRERLSAAYRLVEANRKIPLAGIAASTGFGTEANLSRFFRRRYGMEPAEVRGPFRETG
jgi:AraC-like DNA-binding protein